MERYPCYNLYCIVFTYSGLDLKWNQKVTVEHSHSYFDLMLVTGSNRPFARNGVMIKLERMAWEMVVWWQGGLRQWALVIALL